MRPVRALIDWLDSRTGIRAGRKRLLDEELPAGVGWWFVTGSVILMLLTVQLVTGVALTFYYVPSPEFAYDSVRYVMERVTFGAFLRGLHFFGASFIVVAAVIHMIRVVALGSYKKPREVTWITVLAPGWSRSMPPGLLTTTPSPAASTCSSQAP